MERKSICENPYCPNYREVADHPRSDKPLICGMCGSRVKIIEVEIKKEK